MTLWADFHFLRPWWLALLPVGVWLIWQLLRGRADSGGWRSVVDAPLRAHVLAEPEVLRESRWPLIAALASWLLAVVALAGPAWERLPVPAFRSEEALVVALVAGVLGLAAAYARGARGAGAAPIALRSEVSHR